MLRTPGAAAFFLAAAVGRVGIAMAEALTGPQLARADDAAEPFVVGVDRAQLAASFVRLAGAAGYDLAELRTGLARLAPG